MQFRSTGASEPLVSFKDVILRCIPPDGGLYVPATTVDMRQFFLYMDTSATYPELVATVTPSLLQGELNPFSASRVAESAFDFEPELVLLDERLSVLKLYNGPTGVFKDFGIAFLAAVMEELIKRNGKAMILSAARGHSGTSMARAFNKRKGMTSVILYPEGPIHGLDEEDFVTHGGNILPIQIEGNYGDCQRLIREAINDRPFAERYSITSANAINAGRLLPQSFYYLYAFIKVKRHLRDDLVFSIPSGNFGNLIAALYAWKFGMPVGGFIAAMNINNAFGEFIRGRRFVKKPVVSTLSPALDVASPENYTRLESFYREAPVVMRNMVFPDSVDDKSTMEAMEKAWKKYGLLLDPHGAVAFAAAQKYHASRNPNGHVVVMATGHPAMFSDLVTQITGERPEQPERFALLQREIDAPVKIAPSLDTLETAVAALV
ncbi:MAG: threonine synthase [Spirochaetaceae bacterium]|jgi:threonine synthase|nr:threonine synthase [Spirochaetaceae bacterium]